MTFDEIEEQALDLIKRVASSSDINVSKPPIPVEQIAEEFLGLSIIHGLPSDRKISGIIQLGQKRILVNSKEPAVRRRFSVAHEIAHWTLHAQHRNGQVIFRTRKSQDRVEAEANAFAAAILMPTRLIYDHVLENLVTVTNFEVDWLMRILDLLPPSQFKIFNKLLFSQFFQNNTGSSKKREHWANTLISLIPRVAKEFQVSKEALSVRMQVLGLLTPIYNIK